MRKSWQLCKSRYALDPSQGVARAASAPRQLKVAELGVAQATLPCVPEDVLLAPPAALPLPDFTLDALPQRPSGFMPLSAAPAGSQRATVEDLTAAGPVSPLGYANGVRGEESGESRAAGSQVGVAFALDVGGLERLEDAGTRVRLEDGREVMEADSTGDLLPEGLVKGVDCRTPMHANFEGQTKRAVASVV